LSTSSQTPSLSASPLHGVGVAVAVGVIVGVGVRVGVRVGVDVGVFVAGGEHGPKSPSSNALFSGLGHRSATVPGCVSLVRVIEYVPSPAVSDVTVSPKNVGVGPAYAPPYTMQSV
jgi:hypothetical protein